jgi:uncharacterized membrane protein SpoIIM required for sporulation
VIDHIQFPHALLSVLLLLLAATSPIFIPYRLVQAGIDIRYSHSGNEVRH